jgi:hypothetical protein
MIPKIMETQIEQTKIFHGNLDLQIIQLVFNRVEEVEDRGGEATQTDEERRQIVHSVAM